MKTKRFIKQLPFRYGFVFKDPKDAGEFYQFVNIKLADTSEWSAINLPLQLEGTKFYFSLYEVEKTTKTFNLLPLLIDEKITEKGHDPLLSEHYMSRIGQWYIMLTVHDNTLADTLAPQHPQSNELIHFLEPCERNTSVQTIISTSSFVNKPYF